jgi:ubiquinone/menaquinone biosynthesis C-methylase UbiE
MKSARKPEVIHLLKENLGERLLDNGILSLAHESAVTELVTDFYTQNPFPNYDEFEDIASLINKSERNVFMKNLKKGIGLSKTIIEVGSGTSQFSINLAARTNNNVIAFDPTLASLVLGRDFAHRNDIANCTFVNGDLFLDPFKPESFDVVWCSGVLHHTKDPKGGFKIISNWVKRDGTIIIGLYNKYGRLRTVFRQKLFKLLLQSQFARELIFLLDPILRMNISKAKKDAWFQDPYEHPVESLHTMGEVLEWFEQAGIAFVTAYPRTDFQDFDFRNPLNETGKGSPISRFYAQVGMIFSNLGSEGGLFLVIGRKV